MAGTIRARVKGGMLEPLETLNLPEGKEVTVTILDVPSARDVEAFRRSAVGWKGPHSIAFSGREFQPLADILQT